jgi:hypothetical protein
MANGSGQYGQNNVAIGYDAMTYLGGNFLGSYVNGNTAVGTSALQNMAYGNGQVSGAPVYNTAIGYNALSTNGFGDFNTAIGVGAGASAPNGSYNIYLGSSGLPGDNFTMRLGYNTSRTFMTGISGVTTGLPASPVYIDANGQLGTAGPGGFASSASGNAFLRDSAGSVIGSVQPSSADGTSRVQITVNSVIFTAPYSMTGFINNKAFLYYTSNNCTGTAYVQFDQATGFLNAPLFVGATPTVAYISSNAPQTLPMNSYGTPSGTCTAAVTNGYFAAVTAQADLGIYVPPFAVR